MKNLKLLSLAFLLLATACSGPETDNGPAAETKQVNVETKTITPQTFESFIKVIGTVESSNDILISSEVGGRVIKHHAKVGQYVKKGQTILKIDDAKLQQELKRLEALTAQSRTNFERLQRLYEEENIGSEIDYLNARYAYEQNQSALASVKVDLERTTINAPFDAVVEDILIEEGEMAAPGMQIVRLIGSNQFKVSAGIPARYADVVQAGDKVKIWFDSQNPDTIETTVSFAGSSINPQNRTFRIEINLPERKDQYKIDMPASLELTTNMENNVAIVSEEFLYRRDGKFVLFVLAEDENGNLIAEQRPVEIGPRFRMDVIIRKGLAFGEKVITTGSAFLSDGMRVNPIENSKGLAAN